MILYVLAAVPLVVALLVLAWVDIRTGLLPDLITLPLAWLGLLINLDGLIAPLKDSVLGAVFGYMILWTANQMFRRIAGQDGMGYGDFKMTAALGAWFGMSMLPWIVMGACITGLGAAFSRQRSAKNQPMPFGPCLSVAGVAAMIVVFSR
ncbi:A24 family peptidase [Pusillimonas sp. T7-7]|uniref:prepilin peptidase n=1 Tax=Pusillimonas sp. (strain T7-7) TaxID=1007105 RepID=UPI000674B63F|nr:A24 family peptidase [Pusillimonas sp. T7-7]